MEQLYLIQNHPRLEMIQVINGDITYYAEGAPGSSHTAALWVCSRKEVVSETVTVISVLPGLQIPGTNGAGLAALFGD